MRFKSFIINEKVKKTELKQIFNDESIICGAEFEFYMADIVDESTGTFQGVSADRL